MFTPDSWRGSRRQKPGAAQCSFLKEPSDEEVRQFLSAQGKLPFTYGEVGASREDATAGLPPGYAVDRYRMKLGEGIEAYARAVPKTKP